MSRKTVHTRWGGLALASATAVLMAALAAPSAQQPQQRPEQPQGRPAGQQAPAAEEAPKSLVPVAASSVAANPDRYYGQLVSLMGTLEREIAPTVFAIDQDKTKTTGQEVYIFARRMNGPLEPNTYVTAIGELVKFDPADPKVKDYLGGVDPAIATAHAGKPVILANSVVSAAGVDLAMRLPPPMTPEELAFQGNMKRIQPASGALRKAIEGSDVALARENAATLQKSFEDVAKFFDRKDVEAAQKIAEDARGLALAIDRAAVAGRWDEVKATAGNLTKTCGSCHNTYRDRFDDGSFRVKLPGGGR